MSTSAGMMFLVLCLLAQWMAASGAAVSGLPLIQISHDELGEDYPEMHEEVHLEDFFWTGSGDGPPEYLKKVHTGISKGKDVVVKTETVVATVYVDGNNEIDIPICLDCPPDDGGTSWDATGSGAGMPPLNYSATDRRYWLLTVMSGFYTNKDNPMLEEKLARLYRLAFTRQQSKHLGINGAQQVSGLSVPFANNGRNRRQHAVRHLAWPTTTTEKDPSLDVEVLDMLPNKTNFRVTNRERRPTKTNTELNESSEEEGDEWSAGLTTGMDMAVSATTEAGTASDIDAVTLIAWELIQQGEKLEKMEVSTSMPPPSRSAAVHPLYRKDSVRVVIHNLTQITEDEVQKGGPLGATSYAEDVNEKIDDRPVANQTELIYSVFVNGRPVLAVAAANDMKLVSEDEVVSAIGKEIIMKAEPYLREPQATPLAPATRSGTAGFIDSIQNNTALVVVSSIAILLLLLLVVALMLMGRTKTHNKNQEANRNSSRNELISGSQTGRATSSGTVLETGRTTVNSRDIGVQNFSYENEPGREPRIHFPGPPAAGQGSQRNSLSSSDNTSDSSVYCPINPPTADVQRMLDAKAATLFERHRRRHHHHNQHQYDRAEGHEHDDQEPHYAQVANDKKRDKLRNKAKRRYISENRVGSLETSPRQRSGHSSGDEVITGYVEDDDGLQRSAAAGRAERNEAFNPNNQYHRNKLLQSRNVFSDKEQQQQQQHRTNEAINKEIMRALQPSEKSSDTGSIGSFLSMASVRAFPKSAMPEPLNRVLEPVFVTYYDNMENGASHSAGRSEMPEHSKHRGRRSSVSAGGGGGGATVATIESFPSPKAPQRKPARAGAQSDNPDPGVVGPVVWERHKKRLGEYGETDALNAAGGGGGGGGGSGGGGMAVDDDSDADDCSPLRDPAVVRNHYEDLIEGAMQMYSSQDDLPMPLPTCDFTNKRKPINRENRGSSAGGNSFPKKQGHGSLCEGRPATAQPENTAKLSQSTLPPSPSSGAWGGSFSSTGSVPMRPLSAGPFHRPAEQWPHHVQPPKSATNRSDVSAAPLIEAIQNELRKYKEDGK